jgi:hypothetical protein
MAITFALRRACFSGLERLNKALGTQGADDMSGGILGHWRPPVGLNSVCFNLIESILPS